VKIEEYLNEVADVVSSDITDDDGEIYVTKFNGDYITRVGMEDDIKFLADLEITDDLTHGVGFSPKDGKWYGWSHRAIYGFEIGSTCKKGECHYKGSNLEEQEVAAIDFWKGPNYLNVRCKGILEKDGERYFDIIWEYDSEIPNEKLRGTTGGVEHHIKSLGRGEWTAETMADAKQMAVDFNEGVS